MIKLHWTEDSPEDFAFYLAEDFADAISGFDGGIWEQLCRRVATGTATLKQIVESARAAELKVTILAYDDGDPQNLKGPIVPEVFLECWHRMGSPKNMFEVRGSQ